MCQKWHTFFYKTAKPHPDGSVGGGITSRKNRKGAQRPIRMAAREGDMLLAVGEPARAMPTVVSASEKGAREGDTPGAWRVALAGYN